MTEDRARSLLELLIHVSREVAAALDLRTVLQRLIFACIQYVGGERGSIVVLDDNGKPADAAIVYGKTLHEHTTQQLRDIIERGLAGWVTRNRKPALVRDTSKDERWLRRADDSVEHSGAKSAICVPLLARDRLVGALTLVHPVPNTFTEEHLELMQAIADQASVAVLNARLYTESQRTARVMTALAEGAASINASLELSDVWRRILNQTMQALQVETVALALVEPGGDVAFQAAAGHNAGVIPGRRVPAGKGVVAKVVALGKGAVIPASKTQSLVEEEKFGGIEIRALAIAPILSQGKAIGALEAINPIAGTFDPDALLVMSGLGSLAGTAIQNAQFLDRLQKAHERYRELFEDSIDPILITDWEGVILEANRHAVNISGYNADQLRKMSIDQLHEVKWSVTGLNFETLKYGDGCHYESFLHRYNSAPIHVEAHARRVEFEQTDCIQWIMRDITARKELEAMRNDLLAMVYHDLRSPLGNIISSLEMLDALPSDSEEFQTMLEVAKRSTARIQRLVNSLLDVHRLESGNPVVNQEPVDPVELVAEALSDAAPAAAGKQQIMENKAKPPLPLIWADRDMIRRALTNLLENASKFTPSEGRIEIGATPIADGYVKFFVRDNGPGIPPADAERIFEKFTRLRGKDGPGGLGIGLAFCRLAVQGHGGQIWVESEEDKGATFYLTLPIAVQKIAAETDR